MQLILTKATASRITAETRRGDALVGRVTATFTDDRHFANAADVLDVDRALVLRLIDAFQRSDRLQDSAEITEGTPAPTFRVRGRTKPDATAEAHPTLASALAAHCEAAEPLILWSGTGHTCALDVDVHGLQAKPSPAAAYQMIERVSPRPSYAWQTHGAGLRLVYEANASATAEELAAVGALSVVSLDPLLTVELKADTRHPAYSLPDGRACGPVRKLMPTTDYGPLRSWLGRREVSEEQVGEWLAAAGLVMGRRYPHERCPVQPCEPGNREPVVVREEGVFCHACNGRGVTFGHKVPGWFTFAALAGDAVPTQLLSCIDSLTHWEHARFVLREAVPLGETIAKAAYSAALKLRHPDDPRVGRVFVAGVNFIRFSRRWATLGGETYTKEVGPILQNLPACQFLMRSGKLGVDLEAVARLSQPTDLAPYGYPALSPVWGCRIYGHRLPNRDPNRVPIVLHRPDLAPDCMRQFRPAYILPASREYTEEEAWGVLEEVFPGVNRAAVKLLVAAKGVAEGEVGLPPMVFLSGPTGSAKTSTVMIAAAISGDANHSVPWNGSTERVRQSLLEAKEQGSYVTFNEIVKEGRKAGAGIQAALDFLLNLTPDSLSHKLYVGPVHLGSLPVSCFTDTSLPVELKHNAQLARRLVHIQLPQRVAWEETIRGAGLNKIESLRIADPRYASACNTLLSVVIDAFFTRPTTFEEIAGELGFTKLEASEEAHEQEDVLRSFFSWVVAAPAAAGADARRWSGKGWKVIERGQQTELADLWRQIADEGFTSSERVNETDWARLLGLPGPVVCEVRAHGYNKVAVRFVRKRTHKDYDANEEII